MSEYKVTHDQMTQVADAIRAKGGTTEPLVWPDGFADAVDAMQVSNAAPETMLVEMLNHTLKEAVLPGVTRIYQYVFSSCPELVSLEFPDLKTIDSYAFFASQALRHVYAPKLQSIGTYSFRMCGSLKTFEFFESMQYGLNTQVFNACTSLSALVLRKTSKIIPNSATNSLTGTPIASGTGYIYVPAALLDTYKAATNWSTYASQFRVLEDYTVDGTVTGELDESKI